MNSGLQSEGAARTPVRVAPSAAEPRCAPSEGDGRLRPACQPGTREAVAAILRSSGANGPVQAVTLALTKCSRGALLLLRPSLLEQCPRRLLAVVPSHVLLLQVLTSPATVRLDPLDLGVGLDHQKGGDRVRTDITWGSCEFWPLSCRERRGNRTGRHVSTAEQAVRGAQSVEVGARTSAMPSEQRVRARKRPWPLGT